MAIWRLKEKEKRHILRDISGTTTTDGMNEHNAVKCYVIYESINYNITIKPRGTAIKGYRENHNYSIN